MIVIGNNIAVAFGLVGAFSIIRFRSAISDPKDIAFIFFGMAAGIASGLGNYIIAILFTVSLVIIIFFLYYINFGKVANVKKRLTLTVPENLHDETIFNNILSKHLSMYALKSIRTSNQGTMIQLEYVIQNKPGVEDKTLMDDLRMANANLTVAINYDLYWSVLFNTLYSSQKHRLFFRRTYEKISYINYTIRWLFVGDIICHSRRRNYL